MVAGIALASATLAAPALAEKRVALVVGNNEYKNVSKLQKAVNDARTMADTLKQLGFSVMIAENQNRQQFSETLLAFDKAIEPGGTAFFFYAGHGFEIAGQNFLLPTDVPAATEGQEELVRDASVLADRIVERLQNKKARTSILVFDACRNNPFERPGTRAVAGGGGLAPMTQLPEGVFSVFWPARARPPSTGCRTTIPIPIRCSPVPSPSSCCSPARIWSRSPSRHGAWSARRPRPSGTSRSLFISTRWWMTCS